jgi:ABC-type nitrate/sulfonate/bicarbonate transport system substrate-binding protein
MFAAEGLDLALEITPSSVYQFERLAAGEFDLACSSFDNIVAYREGQGAADTGGVTDFVALMGATQIELSLVAVPDVKSIADLKGRSIALDALATGFAFVFYEMLAREGIPLDAVELVAVGATPQRFQAVKSGEHAAALTIEPFTTLAKAAGCNFLAKSTDLFAAYQGGVVAARSSFADGHEKLVDGFIRGYLKALAWTLDPANRASAAELLCARMPQIQPKMADTVMASLLSPRSGLTPEAAIIPDGMATVLDLRSRHAPGSPKLDDIERYLDLSHYRRVTGSEG